MDQALPQVGRAEFGWRRGISVQRLLLGGAVVVVAFLALFPLVMLLLGSVGGSRPGETTVRLAAWQQISRELPLLSNTLTVALLATALAVTFGVSLAWIVGRTDVPARGTLEQLVVVPFYLTPIVGAVGWAILAAPSTSSFINRWAADVFGLTKPLVDAYTPLGIAWVMGIYYAPFCFLFTMGALQSMEPALEESSQVMGAGRLYTAVRITLPLVLPAIAGGALLAFVLAISQFGIPAILGMPAGYYVVTTRIYELVAGLRPDYATAATVGLALSAVSAAGVWLQFRVLGSRQYTTVSGRGFRPRRIRLGVWRWPLFVTCIAYVTVAVLLPLGAIFWTTLLRFPTSSFADAQFTLENYRYIVLDYPITRTAILNTISLGVAAATLGIALSLLVSWISVRTRVRGRRALDALVMIPVAIPAMVFAVGLLWALIRFPLGIYGTHWILLVAFITIFLPFGVRACSATLVQIDKSLEECARVIGASWLRTVGTITLPLLKPGLMAGWVLLLISVFKDLSASALLSTSKTVVLSVAVFDLWLNSPFSKVGALALIQAAIVFLIIWLARRLTRSNLVLQ